MAMIRRISGIVIDSPDPAGLAGFYEQLLGATRADESPDWVTLRLAEDQPTVSVQRSDRYRRPDWATGDPPQQVHLDFLVDDLDVAQQQVLALGGELLE